MCTYYPCKKQSSKIISSLLVQQRLTTLVETQRITYSSKAEKKSVRLRLHDRTWYHGILCREVFGFKLKEMTTQKLYGNYYHNITCHKPPKERIFNTITNITKSTSSYHPCHIIGNIFMTLQAEKQMQAFQGSSFSKQKNVFLRL
jgi:hypothetical protein